MDSRGEGLATYSCYLEILIVVLFPPALRTSEKAHLGRKNVSLSPTLMAQSA